MRIYCRLVISLPTHFAHKLFPNSSSVSYSLDDFIFSLLSLHCTCAIAIELLWRIIHFQKLNITRIWNSFGLRIILSNFRLIYILIEWIYLSLKSISKISILWFGPYWFISLSFFVISLKMNYITIYIIHFYFHMWRNC